MGISNPPFIPLFGVGIPVMSAAQGTIYTDTTNGNLLYERVNGVWVPVGYAIGAGAPAFDAPAGALYSQNDAAAIWSSTPTLTAPGVVQSAHAFNNSVPGTVTLPGAPTAGNILIAFLGSASDQHANVDLTKWTIINNGGAGAGISGLTAYRYVQGGDTAVTPAICNAGGGTFWGLTVIEINHQTGVFANDMIGFQSIYVQNAGFSIPNIATTANHQLAISAAGWYNASADVTTPAGFTDVEVWHNAANYGAEYVGKKDVAASGTGVNPAIIQPTGGQGGWGITLLFQSYSTPGWTKIASNP